MSRMKWIVVCLAVVIIAVIGAQYFATVRFEKGAANMKEGRFADGIGEIRPLASIGHSSSQMFMARVYAFGLGVPRSFDEANRWVTKASQPPFSAGPRGELQYFIGKDLIEGVGTAPDRAEGMRWIQAAQGAGYRGQLSDSKEPSK